MLLKMSEVNIGELLVYTEPFLDFLALLLAPFDRGVLALVAVFGARWIPFFRRTSCNALVNADLFELEPLDPLTVDGVFPHLQ
jgi:hypothetical protein